MAAIRAMLTETEILAGTDDAGVGITLPFKFWGGDDQAYVSSNGYIMFGADAVAADQNDHYGTDLPDITFPGLFCIADMDLRSTTIGSRIVHGPAAGGGYAVLWENVGTYNEEYGTSTTFQICMFPDGRGELNVGSITQTNQTIVAGWKFTGGTSHTLPGSDSGSTPSALIDGGANALSSSSTNSTETGRHSTWLEGSPAPATEFMFAIHWEKIDPGAGTDTSWDHLHLDVLAADGTVLNTWTLNEYLAAFPTLVTEWAGQFIYNDAAAWGFKLRHDNPGVSDPVNYSIYDLEVTIPFRAERARDNDTTGFSRFSWYFLSDVWTALNPANDPYCATYHFSPWEFGTDVRICNLGLAKTVDFSGTEIVLSGVPLPISVAAQALNPTYRTEQPLGPMTVMFDNSSYWTAQYGPMDETAPPPWPEDRGFVNGDPLFEDAADTTQPVSFYNYSSYSPNRVRIVQGNWTPINFLVPLPDGASGADYPTGRGLGLAGSLGTMQPEWVTNINAYGAYGTVNAQQPNGPIEVRFEYADGTPARARGAYIYIRPELSGGDWFDPPAPLDSYLEHLVLSILGANSEVLVSGNPVDLLFNDLYVGDLWGFRVEHTNPGFGSPPGFGYDTLEAMFTDLPPVPPPPPPPQFTVTGGNVDAYFTRSR